jgi:hypothetical protein
MGIFAVIASQFGKTAANLFEFVLVAVLSSVICLPIYLAPQYVKARGRLKRRGSAIKLFVGFQLRAIRSYYPLLVQGAAGVALVISGVVTYGRVSAPLDEGNGRGVVVSIGGLPPSKDCVVADLVWLGSNSALLNCGTHFQLVRNPDNLIVRWGVNAKAERIKLGLVKPPPKPRVLPSWERGDDE